MRFGRRWPRWATLGCEFGLAALLYAGLSLLLYGFAWRRTLIGGGDDTMAFVWFVEWWPWALAHWRDPLVSRMIWSPSGASLAWATSVPALSLLASPVTWLAGPVAAFNLCTMAAPASAALGAFALVRALVRDRAAALIAGFVFGFSGYETGQMLGHLNLDSVATVPLLVLALVAHASGRIGARAAFGLELVLLLLLAGTSLELLASFASLGAGVLVVSLALLGAEARGRAVRAGGTMAAALAACFVVMIPWLVSMVRHRADTQGFINPPVMYSTDLANLLVPTDLEWLSNRPLQALAVRFTGNTAEQGAYLGLPIVLILLAVAWQARRRTTVRIAAVAFVLLFVASLGPVLQVGGRLTAIPLPWDLFVRLPLLEGALPSRFTLYAALAASVLVGCWCAEATGRARRLRIGFAALACLPLVPSATARVRTSPATPAYFSDLAAGGPRPDLLVLPFGSGPPMLWQAVSGMRYRQAGGHLNYVPRRWSAQRPVGEMIANAPAPGFLTSLRALCRNEGVDAIVVGPGTDAALAAEVERIGWPVARRGGVEVIAVPSVAAPPRPAAPAGAR